MKKGVAIDFEKLLTIAESQSEVEALEYNLFELYQLYRRNYQARRLFRAAWLPKDEKLSLLKTLPCFTKSTTFEGLLELMIQSNLTKKIYYLYDGFGKAVDKKFNRTTVQVFSAIQLSLEQSELTKHELEKILGKKVNLKAFVDESLVGGLVVKLSNGRIYDFSYKKLLSEFKYYAMERN